MPGSLSGENIKRGELIRNFKRIVLFQLQGGSPSGVTLTSSTRVENLSKNINLVVQCGAITPGATNPYSYLANPGTLQITPISKGDGNDQDLIGNPVFSSPSFTGALTIPNGWEFSTSIPKAKIDVVVDSTKYAISNAGDQIVLDVIAEYTGAWWDPDAVARLLNKITLTPAGVQNFTGSL